MVGRWSEASTLQFVYYYKLHECLWNTKSDLYTVKHVREAAYEDLVKQMAMEDFDVRAAKVKIKNLRAHYFTELKKIRNAMAIGQRYEPTLYWFKEMDSFLKDVIQDVVSLQQPEVITGDTIYDTSCIYENGIGDVDEDSMGKAMPIFHMSTPETVRANTTAPKKNQSNGETSQRKRRRGANQEPVDEFDLFGKSVAAQLRQLSVSRALRAQTKIQSLLTDERLHDLETTTPPPEHLPIVSEPDIGGSGTPGRLLVPEPSMLGRSIVPEPVIISSGGSIVPEPVIISSGSAIVNEPSRVESDDSRSSSFHEPKPNVEAIKVECDVITLDEDDPFEGH